jgi:hypothetical protein
MTIEGWWPMLEPATRNWLAENNGAAIPPAMATEISEAGGSVTSDASGVHLSDEATDWIEAVANGERPEAR